MAGGQAVVRDADYQPPWWLRGCHGQTLWAALLRRKPATIFRREAFELGDGDRVELAWHGAATRGTALILHGLEGSCHSPYAAGLAAALAADGLAACVLHFRGCGGRLNRYARNYHSGDTNDLAEVLAHLRRQAPDRPLLAVGYSLGGNALLKYLGTRAGTLPDAAVAVSVPFRLDIAARTLATGFSRLYQRHLVTRLHAKIRAKAERLHGLVDLEAAFAARDFFSFDDVVTAPLHGFKGVDDYYGRSSCRQYLSGITTPTLIVHASDDPFMDAAAIPTAAELGPAVELELAAGGGHVGFVEGRWPWRARYWLEHRIPAWLRSHY